MFVGPVGIEPPYSLREQGPAWLLHNHTNKTKSPPMKGEDLCL
jgi:hypothetical protein